MLKRKICEEITKTLAKNNYPTFISGGSTIKEIFLYLRQPLKNIILLSDERLVKKNSKLRNDLFFKKLVRKKIIQKKKFIFYNKSNFDKLYLKNFNNKLKNIKFKIAILGFGRNGHLASIFNYKANENNSDFYFIDNSPKFPSKRVTVSVNMIRKCEIIYIIASKKSKKREIEHFSKFPIIKKIGIKKIRLITF